MPGLEQLVDFLKSIDNTLEESSLTSLSQAIDHMNEMFMDYPKLFAINYDTLLSFLEQMVKGTFESISQ